MKAMLGVDYVRDKNWNPVIRSRPQWEAWAHKEAKKRSRSGFKWNAMVAFIPWRGDLRISFAGQPAGRRFV